MKWKNTLLNKHIHMGSMCSPHKKARETNALVSPTLQSSEKRQRMRVRVWALLWALGPPGFRAVKTSCSPLASDSPPCPHLWIESRKNSTHGAFLCIALGTMSGTEEQKQYVRYFHDRGKQVQMGIVTHAQLQLLGPDLLGFLGVFRSVSSLAVVRFGLFTHAFSADSFSVPPPPSPLLQGPPL